MSLQLAIVSDVHYASPQEVARRPNVFDPIRNPLRRLLIRQYRRWFWLHDPFSHNHLFDRFLDGVDGADFAVANGDYSCDSAYIGVADDCAFASARMCLDRFLGRFGPNCQATIGDHEIGKKMLGAEEGGLRLASFRRAELELQLQPVWTTRLGRYVLIGITSTLAALPVYESEALAEEISEWRELRTAHLESVASCFDMVQPGERILLFCHDPTALPYLGELAAVHRKFPQIERTIIGHLHSNLFVRLGRFMAGMPEIRFLGHTPRRMSAALRQARSWAPFRILLCPSLTGLQLLKDGGYFTVKLDPDARIPPQYDLHRLNWT